MIFPLGLIAGSYCSVVQSCMTLWNLMDCSRPSFPVLHHLPELDQTHVHWVGDTIQSSHPLLSLHLLPSIFPSIRVFSKELALHIRWPSIATSVSSSVLPMNIQDLFPLEQVWSPRCPRDSQESSPTPQFKSINSMALSFLYGPTLTSIHDYWKNHSFVYTDLCWQSNVSAF